MSSEVTGLTGPDFDRIVNRLLARLKELETNHASGSADGASGNSGTSDGLRGLKANQLDARGNRGGIWYVIESKWSMVAIIIAALALGIAIMTATNVTVAMMESRRELAREERLKINAVDDLRMEFRAVLRAAGVESETPENTDISQLAQKAVKGKKP